MKPSEAGRPLEHGSDLAFLVLLLAVVAVVVIATVLLRRRRSARSRQADPSQPPRR